MRASVCPFLLRGHLIEDTDMNMSVSSFCVSIFLPMPKLAYRYSLKWDLVWAFRTNRNAGWLKSKKLVVFNPSLFQMIKLWFKKPIGPEIGTEFPVVCYWISSGTWGSYTPPNKIFICPRGLKNIEKVIRHELAHIKYNDEVQKMTYEDKERYINDRQSGG